MGSFSKLTYHIIFATRYRRKTIRPELQHRLYEYIGGIVKNKKATSSRLAESKTTFTFSQTSHQLPRSQIPFAT